MPGKQCPVYAHRFRWRYGFFAATHDSTLHLTGSTSACPPAFPEAFARFVHPSIGGFWPGRLLLLPFLRAGRWFPRSDSPFFATVGLHSPPDFLGVNTGQRKICQPLVLPFLGQAGLPLGIYPTLACYTSRRFKH